MQIPAVGKRSVWCSEMLSILHRPLVVDDSDDRDVEEHRWFALCTARMRCRSSRSLSTSGALFVDGFLSNDEQAQAPWLASVVGLEGLWLPTSQPC